MPRLRAPRWLLHPAMGFGVLLALAITLVALGEPQPSSRPSGQSVVVSGSATNGLSLPDTAMIVGDTAVLRTGGKTRPIPLPPGAVPAAIMTNRGLTVVTAVLDKRQRAFSVTKDLVVRDLGYADAVVPASRDGVAALLEMALIDPGSDPVLPQNQPGRVSVSPSPSSSIPEQQPPLRNYLVRLISPEGELRTTPVFLPPNTRVGVDTAVGLVAWRPVDRVYDAGVAQESLSAQAVLIRPDESVRIIGAVFPLAADSHNLLVWDVAEHRFGLMPLGYVTATTTITSSPPSAAVTASDSPSPTKSASPSASPTTVAGVQWFAPTRGLIVTGPGAFSPDGAAFAVYSQVGSRRRLIVAEVKNVGTDQVEVVSLNKPLTRPSPSSPSRSGAEAAASSGASATPSGSSASSASSAAPSTSVSLPAFHADGYPVPAPCVPMWSGDTLFAPSGEGQVVAYRPGQELASILPDPTLSNVVAIAVG